MFDITAGEIFDTCNSTTAYDGEYEIQIDGSTFSMGDDWTGTWDPKTSTGLGESEHVSETIRFCTKTTWTEVNVTFTSKDEFTGEIVFRRRVNGSCSTPCVTTWGVSGTRQVSP